MAMVLNTFIRLLGEQLAAMIKEEVAVLYGVRRELESLQKKLSMIENVVEDAEKNALHDTAIRHWTDQLRDIMYDTDDIVDEYRARQLLVRRPELFSCIGRLSLRHHIGNSIKSINLKIDDVSKQRLHFQLMPSSNYYHPPPSKISTLMTSPVVESDIVGTEIEEDTKNLVDMLTKVDMQRRGGVLVFAVVGIGGIGKTTLAQRIYNDPNISSSFPVRMWVCVSKQVSEVNLLKEILGSAGGYYAGVQTRASLEPVVENLLSGKKFLLVLDDVWSEQVWEDLLRNTLRRGASGSRILVTTRNEGVALKMKAVDIHWVDSLSPDDGWALICKKVALSGEEEELEGLKDLGLEIVKKCDGLPLAIKTVGGVLCTKDRSRRAWERILQSTTWSSIGLSEGLKGALLLSYEDLPPHLKQCFLYCSLFPQDFVIHRHFLVMMWIAEGFVREAGDLSVEDVGDEYYRELVQRCFLQPGNIFYDDQMTSTIHDLLRSLAKLLKGDENLLLLGGLASTSNLAKARRISIIGLEGEGIRGLIDVMQRQNSLRTLYLNSSWVGEKVIDDFVRTFTRLRVLHWHEAPIRKLPYSIGNLVHLRFLDLSKSDLRQLPKSIANLVNLQFLILEYCKYLHYLGEGVVKLRNLRCLALYKTPVKGMPLGIGRLQDLNTITRFVVNKDIGMNNNSTRRRWASLEELVSLQMLRHLVIYNLERAYTIHTDETNSGHILKNKLHLMDLQLHCTHNTAVNEEEEKKRIKEVFDLLLCPPPGLEKLVIEGFYGINFPRWLASDKVTTSVALHSLKRLSLIDCGHCGILPPLGKLPSLEYLAIEGARSVKTIGIEFFGWKTSAAVSLLSPSTSFVSFPKLEYLEFIDMPNWEKWEWEVDDVDDCKGDDGLTETSLLTIPRLKELRLIQCPKLTFLPIGLSQATSLTDMVISFCGSLTEVRGFPCLRKLTIENRPNGCLQSISDLPALQRLKLRDYAMKRLPEWLLGEGGQQQFPALQKLEIWTSHRLLRRCLEVGDQDWSKIQHFPQVYGHSRDESRYFSYTRSPKPLFNTNLNLLDDDDDDAY